MIKNMPEAIIEIPSGSENLGDQQPVVEVLIKVGDKVVYHNKTYAVVMNMVQSMTKITEDKEAGDVILEGDSQTMAIGHPVVSFFAIDQLREKMAKVGLVNTAMGYLKEMIKDPTVFDKVAKIITKQTDATKLNMNES